MAPADELLAALAALRPLLDRDAVEELDELGRRLSEDVLRVLVAGEAKRGKSTLINALLQRTVLPSGVLPLTAVPTVLRHGSAEDVEVTFADGRIERLPLSALPGLVTEPGNPRNAKGLAQVVVRLDASLLSAGVEFVDTPGTGSVYAHNTEAAERAYAQMDAAVVVIAADPPVTAAELALIGDLRRHAVRIFCVLNKADQLDRTDLPAVLRFTEEAIAPVLGEPPIVYPVSARAALPETPTVAAADGGFAAFADAVAHYLSGARGKDLVRSIGQHALRLASAAVDELGASLAALDLAAGDLDRRLAELDTRLAEIDRDRADGRAVVAAEIRRQVRLVTEAAGDLLERRRGEVVAASRAPLAEAGADLAEIERIGRQRIADRVRAIVDDWRRAEGDRLDTELGELDARLSRQLTAHIRAAREAVARLFPVALPELAPVSQLRASRRFGYSFAVDPGSTELLFAVVRSHLPKPFGRRRVAAYLADQAVLLLDKQSGRARADFQERLEAHGRELLRELDRRYADGAGRVSRALHDATAVKRAASAEQAAVRAAGRRRREEIAGIMAELRRLTGDPVARP
jgi:GTP-binding protein EngB required for normal cell division